jgi:glycosyltransferase involved in cell wall biosynthesis
MTVKDIQSVITVKDLPAPPVGKRGWPWTVGSRPLPLRRADGSEWPRLSIVTPSYNQGQFLEATIRSVLLQGYPNLEYIVIDGGSSDNSIEIIKNYSQYLNYWISEKDEGQVDAINKGLSVSTGVYIGWLNSDDMYTKQAFPKAISALLNSHKDAFIHGNRIQIDAQDRICGCSDLPAFNPPTVSVPVFSETAFWTRSIMDKAGMLDPTYQFSMDLEFFTRLHANGEAVKSNEFLGYFRCHVDSKTSLIANEGRQETDKLWLMLFDIPYPNHTFPSTLFRLRMLRGLIKNPIDIGIPYISKRLGDLMNDSNTPEI